MNDMNEPIRWELVPSEGGAEDAYVYRAKLDGRGWLVMVVSPANGSIGGLVFIPDENNMWGK
jgi:hypothetical protein